MGHTDVVVDKKLELEEVYAEWQDGVLRADKPADNAICNNGLEGNDRSS